MRNSTVQQSGEYGGDYYADTSAHTGNWQGLYAVADAVVSSVTCNITNFPSAVTISAGSYIPGVFTAITLTSGKVIMYNRKY